MLNLESEMGCKIHNKENLRPLWDAILDVWDACFDICKRHNLRIWVSYGTAIGAVRHKGFIPWDDDFDVMMPISDYNLFIKYAEKELPPYMRWHSIENDSKYRYLFGKVQDERVEVLNRVKDQTHLNLRQGIFIDFFPLDGLPSSELSCFVWYVKRSFIRRMKLFGDDLRRMQDWMSKKSFDESSNVAWLLSNIRYPRCVFKKQWFADTNFVDFENGKVPVPIGVHEVLTHIYGDYMRLPPMEKRRPSHQLSISES